MFQHTATRRWLPSLSSIAVSGSRFQHTATRRWLLGHEWGMVRETNVSTHSHPKVAAYPQQKRSFNMWVSTHSHPKVAATTIHALENPNEVSTHSHPKVAASRSALSIGLQTCFNTQPPEGGCRRRLVCSF